MPIIEMENPPSPAASGIALRPYQEEAQAVFLNRLAGGLRRGIINLPTGCGKTVTGLSIAKKIGGRTLWLAHRDELIEQPLRAIRAIWPEAKAGVVKAERHEAEAQIVFASIQTACRPGRIDNLGRFNLVVIDEAHHAAAETYRRVMEAMGCFSPEGPPALGLTATVERGDKLALDCAFEDIVYQLQLLNAIKDGWLVDLRMRRVVLDFNLDEVGIVSGDYNQGRLGEAMLRAGAAEATATAYIDHANDRKALIFTVTVDQARRTAEALKQRGVRAEWLSGETPTDERRAILSRLSTGETMVVANCAVLTEGFDEPSISSVMVARPTRSKTLYLQMIGRGTRKFPGKEDCLIVDLVGASTDHNLIQAPVLFGLTPEQAKDLTVTEALEEQEKQQEQKKSLEDALVGSFISANRKKSGPRKFHWIKATSMLYAASAGDKGMVLLIQKNDGWVVTVAPREREDAMIQLENIPVDLELAQGIGEDYIRRASAERLVSESAAWRRNPASQKVLAALAKFRVTPPPDATAGEAADLLTAAIARAVARRIA
ncbi:MAG: DEAD/DEAH box helicase [Elusimicrobiota bacterium]